MANCHTHRQIDIHYGLKINQHVFLHIESISHICDYFSESEYESDENTVNVNSITPYNFEPLASANQRHDVEELASTFLPTRAYNLDWCKCGSCRPMETEDESKCCRDDEEVPLSYFGEHTCVTSHSNFLAVCLQEQVLKTTLYMLNNIRGDTINIRNSSMRYAGYRQYSWWVHNHLGKGVRKVIPSCAIWAIRDTYPEHSGYYVPYQEAKDELNA